jgi:hypothetical protein
MHPIKPKFVLLLSLATALTFTDKSQAVSFIGNRSLVAANDQLKWESVGAEYDAPSNPVAALSQGGLGVTATLGGGASFFELRDEGGGWTGNFAPGARILTTDGNAGPLTLSFAAPVLAAGLQIQSDAYGSFSGTIEALDSSSNSLGIFAFSGSSTTAADDSAAFIGVLSGIPEISGLVINLSTGTSLDSFGVNYLSIQAQQRGGIPDAMSSVGCLLGGLGLLTLARRNESRRGQ